MPIPTDLRGYRSRSIDVELRSDLHFQMLEVQDQPRPSQWARVWPTAVAVSRWLLAQPLGSLPSSAVELGCGMGLVGLTAAHLGLSVEVTDRQPLALAFALENAHRNGVLGVTASVLDWGAQVVVAGPLILASDVVYELEASERLFSLIQTAGLLGAGGRLVLGLPSARTVFADQLMERLVGDAYVHQVESSVVAWEGRSEAIDVHVLTRPRALASVEAAAQG